MITFTGVIILFEFSKLNDVDYEMLCLDIMQRKLNTKLRVFPRGSDGGIDLTNNLDTLDIVIQVKHYERSTVNQLINALEKEVVKVNKLNPKQYYIFTSKSLTPNNIRKIYSMFKEYMESDRNIITRENISDFLKQEENKDILHKHFKLWMTTDYVLKELLNHDIFIDSEVLIHDINESFEYFVQTSIFDKCIKILDKERKILLYGDPGVGKTINSYMLVLRYIKKGYQVRFSSSTNIASLKRAITANRDVKEVILLDDFLGQHYFNLGTGEDKEILSLIKHIDLYENKILILNSRVTIWNHALSISEELSTYINKDRITIKKINMNEISDIEKARIFYNQLKQSGISNKYYESIRKNKNYLNIINHKNYNPRIFEHVTLPKTIKKVEPNNYYNFIINNLNHPSKIWANEFQHNLSKVDRVFMLTLYTLTDRYVPTEELEKAFNYNISAMQKTDYTIDIFTKTLSRLNESMVKVIESNGREVISVLNPSLNDFMKEEIFNNKKLHETLLNRAIYLEQLIRLYPKNKLEEKLKELAETRELLKFNTINILYDRRYDILLNLISRYSILDDSYIHLLEILPDLSGITIIENYRISNRKTILKFLTNKELRDFYNIELLLSKPRNLDKIFDNYDLEETIELLNVITELSMSDYPFLKDYITHLAEELAYIMEEYIYDLDYGYYIDINDYDQYFSKSEATVNSITNKIYVDIVDEVSNLDDQDTERILREELEENISLIKSNTKAAFESYRDSYFPNEETEKEETNSVITIDSILDRNL